MPGDNITMTIELIATGCYGTRLQVRHPRGRPNGRRRNHHRDHRLKSGPLVRNVLRNEGASLFIIAPKLGVSLEPDRAKRSERLVGNFLHDV